MLSKTLVSFARQSPGQMVRDNGISNKIIFISLKNFNNTVNFGIIID